MNGHGEIRKFLALAAAGALSEAEEREIHRHAASCEACAGELRAWEEMTGALRRMPTPLAPAALVERTRDLVEREAARAREANWEATAIGLVTLMSWALAASFWAVLAAVGYSLDGRRVLFWSVAWLLTTTVTAGVAAGSLAARRREWRIQ